VNEETLTTGGYSAKKKESKKERKKERKVFCMSDLPALIL
jgi:hypothetical protein